MVPEMDHKLHVEIIPGTEVMVDDGNHGFVKAGNRVLVPQPSQDPRDPLVRRSGLSNK